MKYSTLALITLLLMSGCAAKHKAQAQVAVPQKCILGGLVDKARCSALNAEQMVCDKVVVKFACVEVKK